ncbi:MAG: DUF1203 domain-containing protein [Pseudomonadota bacterium]
MSFQIRSLPASEFAHLFALSDAELAERNACRQIVTQNPGTPCRVSLQDAEIGETVVLLNYMHQPCGGPYQASHAIFVRENAEDTEVAPDRVPDVIRTRLISLRFFDEGHQMVHAEVASGDHVAEAISAAFEREDIAYGHLHNAKPGCFAASVHRVASDASARQ